MQEDEATIALRLVTLVILGLTLAWWFVDGGLEPVITGVAAIFGLVSVELVSAARLEQRDKVAAATRPAPRIELKASPLSFGATPHTVGRREVVDALRRELDELHESGRGKLVCVTGEAGIGKTTVAENFLSELSPEAVTIARGRCSERLAGAEAYLPLLEALESLLRGPEGHSVGELMTRSAPSWYRQLVPAAESVLGSDSPGQLSQEPLKREIALFLEHLTRDRPFVLFLEDLQWADVSTVDVLTYVADRFERTETLVLATYRPEDMRLDDHAFLQVRPTLEQRGLLTEIPLRFLRPEDVDHYLALEYPGHSFPPEIARSIHERSEGSPLFVTALLRYLRDQGVITGEQGSWSLTRPIDEVEGGLPTSLTSMIERRIDRLVDSDREILSVSSVQGHVFHGAVVSKSLDLESAVVEDRLASLDRDHGLVEQLDDEALPDGTLTARYKFVHVLYQHALSETIGPTRRIAWSRQVAEALIQHYGEDDASVAVELGLLFEAARDFGRAAAQLRVAAQHALRLAAPTEAVALSRRALAILDSFGPGSEPNGLELELLIVLGSALSQTEGWGFPEVIETYQRARELAKRTGEVSGLHPLLIQGLFYYWTRREVPSLLELHADQCAIADATDDSTILALVRFCDAGLEFWHGNVGSARPLYEEAMAAYEAGQDRARFVYGQDPHIASSSYASWNLCLAGYPDQGQLLAKKCMAEAHELDHPFTTVYGFGNATWVSIMRRDVSEALTLANQTLTLAEQHEFPFYGAYAGMQRAWALAHQGRIEAGLSEMSDQLRRYQETGSVLATTFFLALLAEIHLLARQQEEGLSVLERAMTMEVENEEFTFDAELHRLRGELLRLEGHAPSDAESCFHSALEISREQESRWFGLRAAVSLGRLLRDEGRREEARALLDETYGWFTEGFDTADLREAKHLMETLEE